MSFLCQSKLIQGIFVLSCFMIAHMFKDKQNVAGDNNSLKLLFDLIVFILAGKKDISTSSEIAVLERQEKFP